MFRSKLLLLSNKIYTSK